MSKAVLISIQPKWCELIANGKKTVEIRKTKPKLETPFKVYIYATTQKKWFRFSSFGYASDESLWLSNGKVKMCDGFEFWASNSEYEPLNGKVIGEFVCNHITNIEVLNKGLFTGGYPNGSCTMVVNNSALTAKEIKEYAKGKRFVYGWHITDFVIYEEPKKLSEFYKRDSSYDNAFGWAFEDRDKKVPITRPPQSWCYVEEVTA